MTSTYIAIRLLQSSFSFCYFHLKFPFYGFSSVVFQLACFLLDIKTLSLNRWTYKVATSLSNSKKYTRIRMSLTQEPTHVYFKVMCAENWKIERLWILSWMLEAPFWEGN